MFEGQKSMLDDFIMNGKKYKTLAIISELKVKSTAELYKKITGKNELFWFPFNNTDGILCYEMEN